MMPLKPRRLRRFPGFATALQAAAFAVILGLGPASAMVGGAPPAADGAGRSVVMILGSYGTACTATAIARDLLLTAAHCVQPGADYKLVASAPGQRAGAQRHRAHRARSAIRSQAAVRASGHGGRGAD